MRMEKTFDDRYKKYFFFCFLCLFIVLLKFLSSSFFFILSQSDHMHVLCVYIKLYSIVKVFWWNQEVAELFAFVFSAFAFPVWSYLNILLYMYVCTIYIQKIYMYMYVYGFALITLALCLYLCHSLVNFLDLSVPIYKWICLLLSGSFWNGFHKN